VTFDTLGLSPPLLAAVKAAGYTTPTPIQQAAIPPALAGRDVLGIAQTGTGKTAAFSLPLLQRLAEDPPKRPVIRALVLTPTRELAAQVGDSLSTYGKGLELWHAVIFGGVSQNKQVDELEDGLDALVATPGRLLDLMQQGHVSLAHVEVFVLDEADRMLDMGFLPDVRRVIAALPPKRQTLFFSATMPPEIAELASKLLVDPVRVAVTPVSSTAERIDQRVYFVDRKDKPRLLVDVLRDPAIARALVFTRMKHGANRVVEQLAKAGIRAAAIHGNKSQNARERAMGGFRDGSLRLLVATDIAARGIDVEGITHVINYDLPNVPETYVHRIGRTARAGAEGTALSFCDDEEREYLVDIERLIGRHVPRVTGHPYPPSFPEPPPTDLTRRGGARPAGAGGSRPGAVGSGSAGGRGGRGGGGRAQPGAGPGGGRRGRRGRGGGGQGRGPITTR
jgi:ATP-dependent RNA helicase RhlE